MRPLILAALLASSPALAEDADLRAAALSAELYALGLSDADALTVLTAARLRKIAGIDQGPTGWPAMLNAAEALARGDATLGGLIQDERAERSKGVASGAVQILGELAPGSTTALPPYTFKSGEYAEVYVEAVADSLLTITIHDAAMNEVCRAVDTAIAYCAWTPAREGAFVVEIVNTGPAITEFILMTN